MRLRAEAGVCRGGSDAFGAAKALLEEAHISTTVYELDDMGREGKILRAALARATGKSHPFGFGICHIPF